MKDKQGKAHEHEHVIFQILFMGWVGLGAINANGDGRGMLVGV